MKGAPYYNYSGSHYFSLESEFHRYSFTFTMRQTTDRDANLQFVLGRLGKGVIDLDNIRLVRVGPKKEEIIPKNFPKPCSDRFLRGITFGNTLDAPQEGAWGAELREDYFDRIKSTGKFDHIRIPVRWDTHALKQAPYTIDPEFLQRVDWAVSHSLHRGFFVVLNAHHYEGLDTNPAGNKEEFIALWRQIAEYFKDYPDNLYFEIYNEPSRALNSYWNQYYPLVYDAIRESNPTRKIIISCPGWANVTSLEQLMLPKRVKADPNILVQFHFYYPNDFCFQGSIGNGSDDLQNRRWTGTEAQKKELIRLADRAAAWAKKNRGVRLWNGEFCAHAGFSLEEDRRLWTEYVIQLCEERNIAWAYWDFANDSARIYDPDMDRWTGSAGYLPT
jgi:endoglucanase